MFSKHFKYVWMYQDICWICGKCYIVNEHMYSLNRSYMQMISFSFAAYSKQLLVTMWLKEKLVQTINLSSCNKLYSIHSYLVLFNVVCYRFVAWGKGLNHVVQERNKIQLNLLPFPVLWQSGKCQKIINSFKCMKTGFLYASFQRQLTKFQTVFKIIEYVFNPNP